MPDRVVPYRGFNFVVSFAGADEIGGFSDVSGLTGEVTVAGYRGGNEPELPGRRVPGMRKAGIVTLKRGVVAAAMLRRWIEDFGAHGSAAGRCVVVILLDEGRRPVRRWILRACLPAKYAGPMLVARGGADVAVEELVLSAEGLDIVPPGMPLSDQPCGKHIMTGR